MLSKQSIYALLEEKMLSYQDIAVVQTVLLDEPLVQIQHTASLKTNPIEPKMLAFTGSGIYVRQSVALMLQQAAGLLQRFGNGYQLEVVYGYRHPRIQRANFESLKKKIADEHPYSSPDELLEATNRCIAVPENAGHTMGGAVDVRLLHDGEPVDMGTESRAFVPDTYVYSPFISKQAWQHRQMLRNVMTGAGFAPFDGEWWHFCYGDKEWAAYYHKPYALYEPINFSTKNKSVA